MLLLIISQHLSSFYMLSVTSSSLIVLDNLGVLTVAVGVVAVVTAAVGGGTAPTVLIVARVVSNSTDSSTVLNFSFCRSHLQLLLHDVPFITVFTLLPI